MAIVIHIYLRLLMLNTYMLFEAYRFVDIRISTIMLYHDIPFRKFSLYLQIESIRLTSSP